MKTFLKFLLTIFFILNFSCRTKLHAIESEKLEAKLDIEVNKILSKMSDEEKAGQVIHISIPKNYLDEVAISELKKIKPGGVILFAVNLGKEKEIRNLNKALQLEMKSLKGLPLFISTDQEGGRVIRVENGVTSFPGAMAMGQANDPNFAYNAGLITSYELKRLGINVFFAPVLDINNNPKNPVINTRSFGMSLEYTNTSLAFEQGARVGGSIPVIKHFPGHGDTTIDSHLGLPIIQKTEEELFSLELFPFQKAIEDGALSVMSAHIVYPKIDPVYPSTLSKKVLGELLRKKLKFKGLVFTDAMEMDAISKNYQNEKTGVLAINAGADVLLLTSFGKNTAYYHQMILEGIKNKEFTIDGINFLEESIKRQIKLKIKAGLFHSKYSYYKISESNIDEYILQNKKMAKEKYTELKEANIQNLNKKISYESIKSYKEEFIPLTKEEVKNSIFLIKNENMQTELSKMNIQYISDKTIKKIMKKNTSSRIIIDTRDQNDIDFAKSLVEKEKDRELILLHYGSPFLEFPETKNCKIILSFSPTKESISALLRRTILSNEKIPTSYTPFK